jgi:LPS transport system D
VVRGGVRICIAAAIALATVVPAFADEPTPPLPGPAPQRYVLHTDQLFNPAPPVPPRTSYQGGRPAGDPNAPDFTLPPGSVIPTPPGKSKQYRFTRRYGTPNAYESSLMPDRTRRIVFTGGVIVHVIGEKDEEIEFATDDAVVWVRGLAIDNPQDGFKTTEETKTEVEVYLTGNVIVRTKTKAGDPQVLRASQVYYDVENDRAVALSARLEYTPQKLTDPVNLHGQEIRRLDAENWEALGASFDASKLPSDPGLRFDSHRAIMTDRYVQLRNAFGIPYRELLTGNPVMGDEKLITAYGAVPRLDGVPLGYFPVVHTDADEPLGPFLGLSFGQNSIYGTQIYTSWDLFELAALKAPPGHKWQLNVDYMSARGPALGTDYTYNVPADPESGLSPPQGFVKLYGLQDHGMDFRGQATWRHQQEIIEGLYFQGQIGYLSDENFLEAYYKQDFDLGPNHETFGYLTWNQGNFWASGLVDPRLAQTWIGHTEWLPRVDAALIGESFFDRLVYNVHGSAGYAQARPSEVNPLPILSTDQNINTGRLDFMQELSVPLSLGPVKIAPYGTMDLTGYSDDLNGDSVGRIWGGAGVRSSLPLSRLYEDVSSDLFNIRGINHKVIFGANYLYARTNVPYTDLPMLDRLNDDATDQAWRNMVPFQTTYVAGPNGQLLANAASPTSVFNPQRYSIRRGDTNAVDTLDNLDVLQMDVRQRWQTKRGYPGQEHTVDMVTLDTSISYFPEAGRDNFGHPFSFLEYDATWNVGDRVALVSTGWFEPYDGGTDYYTVGAYLNRPDRTNFYIGYRQIDPLNSRAVTGSVGYQLSPRYYLNASSSYDFGIRQAMANTFTLTRTGTDLTVSIGINYNSLTNSFGVQFMVVPNLVAAMSPGRLGASPMLGTQSGRN